ncbi:hypothetical protein KC332_g11259 [Hortaea werneckii]|nr:hypothetical protein KC350_g11888 [Hortaea werneckii]KAI6817558.1 hypothetical protein KC358_g10242 [Hortaea werneckii]KAI6843087.1 hypothetical protein KC342_g1176 [Hortaea werneckii]KAI6920401.1 hypothetical protein KC348_g10393 [Hortaea werneckii]KAI6930735.1 hypothetical protein KC341_g10031 [Hortaea werneckii]
MPAYPAHAVISINSGQPSGSGNEKAWDDDHAKQEKREELALSVLKWHAQKPTVELNGKEDKAVAYGGAKRKHGRRLFLPSLRLSSSQQGFYIPPQFFTDLDPFTVSALPPRITFRAKSTHDEKHSNHDAGVTPMPSPREQLPWPAGFQEAPLELESAIEGEKKERSGHQSLVPIVHRIEVHEKPNDEAWKNDQDKARDL